MKTPGSPTSPARASSRSGHGSSDEPDDRKLTISLNNVVEGASAKNEGTARGLLSRLFANVAPRSFEEKSWNPYSNEDSNIEVGVGKSNRIRLDDLLTTALAPLGYRRVDKLTYRADWSTPEVEHILSIETYGNPKIYLTGDAGLRNKQAEVFARQCQGRYCDETVLKLLQEGKLVDPPWRCSMHFSIGMLFGWPGRSCLDTLEFSPEDLARAIVEPIQSKLVPYVGQITTAERLLEFLQRDEEPMLWVRVGAYFRAALVAYLARTLGIDREKTKQIILSRATHMMNALDKTRLTPETYLDRILEDADAEIARTAR